MQAESACTFECAGETLVGILHHAEKPSQIGVLVIVGGPQYRVGSHRQFVHLARFLARSGTTVFRFDHRGIGDSTGRFSGFEAISEDIRAAIDYFCSRPNGPSSIVLWGLCDAASAAMMYAPTDNRVIGLLLANPWARSETGEAKSLLKHYYFRRLFSSDFWRQLLRGEYAVKSSLKSFVSNLAKVVPGSGKATGHDSSESFRERMLGGLLRFNGPVQFFISGRDLTAAEFTDLIGPSREWQRLFDRTNVTMKRFEEANHTFSSYDDRRLVETATVQWIENLRSMRS